MLEIAQAGQAGKTRLLFDMHRLRKRVFKDRMKWDVSVTSDDLEVDQFDTPEAVYLLALDDDGRVVGNWRLLPTIGPTMIRDIWPTFLNSISMPYDPQVWELSRFAVDTIKNDGPEDGRENMAQVQRVTQELFCGVTELCIMCGIRELYTMHDLKIGRLLKRLDCPPRAASEILEVAGKNAQVGAYQTDMAMLERLRAASGITQPLITPDMLPPALLPFYENNIAHAPHAAIPHAAHDAASPPTATASSKVAMVRETLVRANFNQSMHRVIHRAIPSTQRRPIKGDDN